MKQETRQQLFSFTMALAVIFCAATVYYAAQSSRYAQYIRHDHARSFSQLLSSLSAIDNSLQKLQYTAAPGPVLSALSADIWQESENAKSVLETLPISDEDVQQCQKFIAQTGDFAYYLLRLSAGGTSLTPEHLQSLSSLSAVCSDLTAQLAVMQEQLDIGQRSFGGISHAAGSNTAAISTDFSAIAQDFPEYAALIYDGPFSEHITSLAPKYVQGMEAFSQQQAQQTAAEFLGTSTDALALQYTSAGVIPSYCFAAKDGTSVELSRQGGVILSLSDPRTLHQAQLSHTDAVAKAQEYLMQHGFPNMQSSYYTVYENIITVNFACVQDGVTLYPDLIKVGVALDDGSVVRLDTRGYVMNHLPRTLPLPSVSLEQARQQVASSLQILSENMALIPTSGKNEALCHEFLCVDSQGRHILVYVNASTGYQEQILLLLESENGVLTI